MHRDQTYSYTVFQDFGLVTETEYQKLTGMKPDKKSVFDVPFHHPNENSKLYTLGLEGLPADVIAGLRKVRISMADGFTLNTNLLDPSDNLVKSQGKRVFDHLADKQLGKRPSCWKSRPISAGELLEKAEMETERKRQEHEDCHWVRVFFED